jgi:hypothetical protein
MAQSYILYGFYLNFRRAKKWRPYIETMGAKGGKQ